MNERYLRLALKELYRIIEQSLEEEFHEQLISDYKHYAKKEIDEAILNTAKKYRPSENNELAKALVGNLSYFDIKTHFDDAPHLMFKKVKQRYFKGKERAYNDRRDEFLLKESKR